MFSFFKKQSTPIEKDKEVKQSIFTTDSEKPSQITSMRNAIQRTFQRDAIDDVFEDGTMDGVSDLKRNMNYSFSGLSETQLAYFSNNGFIGYQACAMMAQHWLIDKCCTIPAKDAIRKGFNITANDGTDLDPKILKEITKQNKKFKLNHNLVEFEKMGRVFGVRIAMFKIESSDPDYYKKPFNPDGITPNSYKGISQIDPYWIAPALDTQAASDPSSLNFYEPTFWNIGGLKVHRSHLVIMRHSEVPDILKPTYLYGGLPLTQKIYTRVYSAERTSDEAPQLVMTKRSNIFKTDIEQALTDESLFSQKMQEWTTYRDNYGVKVIGLDDEMTQNDTALGDLDNVIMTQYQLVASVANMPSTKLLGTTPKGFSSTGEYEEASYREELENIQEYDLTPFIDRHHLCLIRSIVAPKFKIEPFEVEISWMPIDSITETELADINLKKAQTDVALQGCGAIDGFDIRERVIADKASGYNGMEIQDYEEETNTEEKTMGATVETNNAKGDTTTI